MSLALLRSPGRSLSSAGDFPTATGSSALSFSLDNITTKQISDAQKVVQLQKLARKTFASYSTQELKKSPFHTVLVLAFLTKDPPPEEISYLILKLEGTIKQTLSAKPNPAPPENAYTSPTISVSFLSAEGDLCPPCEITSDAVKALEQETLKPTLSIKQSLTYFQEIKSCSGSVPTDCLSKTSGQIHLLADQLCLEEFNPTDLRDLDLEERRAVARDYVPPRTKIFGATQLWKDIEQDDIGQIPFVESAINELLPSKTIDLLTRQTSSLATTSPVSIPSPKMLKQHITTADIWDQPGLENASFQEEIEPMVRGCFDQEGTSDRRDALLYIARLACQNKSLQLLQQNPHHLILVLAFLAQSQAEAIASTLLLLSRDLEKDKAELTPPNTFPRSTVLSKSQLEKTQVTFVIARHIVDKIDAAENNALLKIADIPVEMISTPRSMDTDKSYWYMPQTLSFLETVERFHSCFTYRGKLPTRLLWRSSNRGQALIPVKDLKPFLLLEGEELEVKKGNFHTFPATERKRVARLCIDRALKGDPQLTRFWKSVEKDYDGKTLKALKLSILAFLNE